MLPFMILIVAALSRLVPHTLHGVGLNFTMVGAGLLFFGARRPRWQAAIAVLAMAATDVYLTSVVYGLPFHVSSYAVTWAWYAGVCLLGSGMLRRPTALRLGLAVLASATSFFVLSNLVVWLTSGMYPHSMIGFETCYALALPFYANDLASTALASMVLFGLPAVAAQVVHSWRAVMDRNEPLM